LAPFNQVAAIGSYEPKMTDTALHRDDGPEPLVPNAARETNVRLPTTLEGLLA